MKKIVILILMVTIIMSLGISSFASESNGYARYSEDTSMPDDSSAYEDNKYQRDATTDVLIVPMSEIPGEGAVMVEKTERQSSGITYDLGPKEEKSEYRLLSHAWTIGSSFLKTSQSVVIGVAEVAFSELESDIVVTMPSAAQVSKSYSNIYNITGNLITTLSGDKNNFIWNGLKYPSGIYIIKAKVGNQFFIKPITLLK